MNLRPGAYSLVHRSNRRKRAAIGTWILVPGPTATCTGRNRAATSTWIHVHGPTATCTGRTSGKGRPQERGSTSRGLQERAQVEQTEKGGDRPVDTRAGAYSHVHRSNRRNRAPTGTWIHVQGPTSMFTGRRGGKVGPKTRGSTSTGLQARS